jgi:hypothetical protein
LRGCAKRLGFMRVLDIRPPELAASTLRDILLTPKWIKENVR